LGALGEAYTALRVEASAALEVCDGDIELKKTTFFAAAGTEYPFDVLRFYRIIA